MDTNQNILFKINTMSWLTKTFAKVETAFATSANTLSHALHISGNTLTTLTHNVVNKLESPISSAYEKFIATLNEAIATYTRQRDAARRAGYNVPEISALNRTFQGLVTLSYILSPSVNTSKIGINTGGKAFRDIKLSDMAYNAVSARTASIQWYSPSVGYKTITYNQSRSTANYAIYEDNFFKIVIIAFRGTANFIDLLSDVKVITRVTVNDDPRFVESRNLYQTIRAAYDNSWTIESTGHSLGGSLCLYLNYLYGIPVNAFNPIVTQGLFNNNPNRTVAAAHIVKGDVLSLNVFFREPHVVGTLKIYPVEDSTYGPYGYHIRSNFYV
jgi:hypothetical protein